MKLVENSTSAIKVKDNSKVKIVKSVIKVTPSSGRVIASKECDTAINALRELNRQAATIKRLTEENQAIVKAEIGDDGREILDSKGNIGATWKFDKDSMTFNAKSFQEHYPELYTEFLKKKTGARKFSIK